MSVDGTNRHLGAGQSMSALPEYFRHQPVSLLPSVINLDAKIPDRAFGSGLKSRAFTLPGVHS